MIRVFNRYVPSRALVLLLGEILIFCGSFTLAVVLRSGVKSVGLISDVRTLSDIAGLTLLALICSHYMELYDLSWLNSPSQMYPRVLLLVGTLALVLAGLGSLFPQALLGREVLLTGLCILGVTWVLWRWAYGRIVFLPALRQRVYVIGNGKRAQRIVEAIRTRAELGMDLAGWAGRIDDDTRTAQSTGAVLRDLCSRHNIDRVVVALSDRRSIMPVDELLQLRLSGVQIEDGTTLLEKISGKIEVDDLRPSWLIFGEGFRLTGRYWFPRRTVSVLLALLLSLVTLPIIPLIALLIKLGSRGPVLYRQKRVGLKGVAFDCYKFRTMRPDAEADSGATWALDDDPRITKVGRFLRRTRLDEIPQIWNVLRGDMAFVGPRPERPEFVSQLSEQIPYYGLRHLARPGITGWAQINYGYGSSVEEAKEKLRYDLYYIRHISVLLDLVIVFYTIRAVIVGRGVR
ncbi:MAG TPA: TIGR03013 family XrtA/PEP-CTERM system glycosyltransferase [Candidatus Acidoferrales bacterium]|nr:TIGR03013 family XrtA/PEP-CTERM system glycosyltransferase [Candidatus Acidoferrales bacterium]